MDGLTALWPRCSCSKHLWQAHNNYPHGPQSTQCLQSVDGLVVWLCAQGQHNYPPEIRDLRIIQYLQAFVRVIVRVIVALLK